MPQVNIEYSANAASQLDLQAIARGVHQRLMEHAGATLAACKTRLTRLDAFLIGDGDPRNAMVHVDLRILPGRTDAQKLALGQSVSTLLQEAAAEVTGLQLQLTVEVRELDGPNYHKTQVTAA